MSKAKLVILGVLSVVVGVPLASILAIYCTPLFRRLEPILHLQLTGHSGPLDLVFYAAFVIVIPSLFLLLRRLMR